jgi:hypothetical protein
MNCLERSGIVVGIVQLLVKMMLLAREEVVAQGEQYAVLLTFNDIGVFSVEHAVTHGLAPILWGGEEEDASKSDAQLLLLVEDGIHGLAFVGHKKVAIGLHVLLLPIDSGSPSVLAGVRVDS